MQHEIKPSFRTIYYWSRGNTFFSGVGSLEFKSDTVLPTARHRHDSFSKTAALPWRNDAKIDHANSLQASA